MKNKLHSQCKNATEWILYAKVLNPKWTTESKSVDEHILISIRDWQENKCQLIVPNQKSITAITNRARAHSQKR